MTGASPDHVSAPRNALIDHVASRSRRSILSVIASLLVSAATGRTDELKAGLKPPERGAVRWLVYYSAVADDAALARYDLVVLDPAYQGAIEAVARDGARVCCYISLGEIREADPYYAKLDPAARLSGSPDWPGTYRVDVRSPSWRSIVLEQAAAAAARGFTGLMLDTLDTPPYLEQVDPVRFRGMREAAIALVRELRRAAPDMMLIMNRGYALLPDVVDTVDAVIAESLLTSPGEKLSWVEPAQVEAQLALLRPAAQRRPALPILSLDYCDPSDAAGIAEIYRRERALGHHPYVATRLLDQIVPEPV